MIAEGGYFDGSEDAILMAGSLIHDSLESICDNTEIEQGNFHGTSFIEDISNPTNLTSEPARTINHIQQQAEFDMDQDLHDHMIQEDIQVETSNWVPAIFSIQNHIISHQSMEQVNDYDAASYPNGAHTAAPDLLNLLQIPRYSMTPAFSSTKHIFGDPGQDAGNHLDINNENDRASIVGDAIEYINELNRTLKELKSLVQGDIKHRMKRLKLDDTAPGDGESSSMQPVKDDPENQLNGAIRSSWIQRRSKECHVDVRIVGNEINIKFSEKKKTNSLLCAAKVLDEFRLEIIHIGGGVIGDQRIFMFNTKISEGSSVYASALAIKLVRAVEMENLAVDIFS
uniref:Uncharacterized protein n=1 Tax=Avena sativa TaxID=4498 RepID=A0ACD5Z4C1_AVESA